MTDDTGSRRPEDKARHDLINPKLRMAGWEIQNYKTASPKNFKGVAVEYFEMGKGVGQADYVLFVNGVAVGIIEAKKQGESLIGKEFQSERYAKGFPEVYEYVSIPLPFVYETNGEEVRFTNLWDPKPRSREVFHFHKPETFQEWIENGKETLRYNLEKRRSIENRRLWDVQREAIENTEESLAKNKPKALIQMATGSGKTFMAVDLCCRLIKHAKAKRILFLVDRDNLGIQTYQEFQTFEVPGEGRKFTELYNVQHLTNNKIEGVNKVCISTIQRIYSMLKGEKDFDPLLEEKSGFEEKYSLEPAPVEYNPKVPIETFDFIIIDECHRSIYNLWKQVLEYFDAFLIGLTATPSKSTLGFFNKNLVMEYSHEEAVADNINVDFTVYNIRTRITNKGSKIDKGETIIKRDKRTRKKRWETLEDDVEYSKEQLDRDVVAKDQIRTIIKTFRDKVKAEIFPGRKHVPKTLIYAKDDNHAEEIVDIVREEFGEGNNFAIKITYKTEGEDPKNLISQFRNEFNPRIAVTVDMVATGTDIKPLEIVFFMRPVRSRIYFEQMKGRACRVMKNDEFMSVTPDATAKERFVIVDAIGVCENEDLNETRPLEQSTLPLEKLLKVLQYGKPKEELVSTLVSKLSRLQKKLTTEQLDEIKKLTNGKSLSDFNKAFVQSIDEDEIYQQTQHEFGEKGKEDTYEPTAKEIEAVSQKRMKEVLKTFIGNTSLMVRLPEMKKETEQIIDVVSIDMVEEANFSPISKVKAKQIVGTFKEFIVANRKDLAALQMFYSKGKMDWKDLKEVVDKIKTPPYSLTPSKLWYAYQQLESNRVHGKFNRIADFISMLNFELGRTSELEPYLDTVDKRFAEWLGRQKESGAKFSQEQLNWLEKIKDHIATSVEILPEDLEAAPFNQIGGLGKAARVFGRENLKVMLVELNSKVGG